ncbi:mucin-2-like isoform X2 [Ostrea edulis]|uniref:mucin-2-like isoform X2 n=1 Tax=Ostrea edulis TaxID=37623 RepID=UPI0024AFFE94|nr:mucin-2-like isoform X2 [Ostrea edulis]
MDVEEQDLGWHYDGFYTFIDTQSYKNPDGFSSVSHSESVQEKNTRRSRLIKISVFWMVVLMLALIIFIIYISNYRDSKIRYYTSEITLTIKQDYTATLGNKNSQEYRELTSQLCSQMEKTFKRSNSYGSNYQFCEVKNLRSGSIIVTFMLYFTDTVDVTNEEVYRIINSSITVVNSTTIFAEYVIDAADISISTTIAVYGRDPLPYLISNSVLPVTQIPSSTVPETTVETTSPQSTSGTSPTLSTSTTTPTTSITFKTTQSTSTTSTTTPTTSTTSKTTQSLSTTSGTTPMLSTTSGTISTLSPTPETTSTETKSNSEPSTAVTVQTSSTTTSAVQNTIPFSTTVQKTSSQSTTVKVTLIASTTQQTTSASYTSLTATTNPSTTVQTTSPDNQTILQSSTTVHGAPSTTTQETSTTYPTLTYISTSSGTVDTTSTPSSTKTTSTLSSTVQSTLPLSSTVQTTSLSSTAARTMITSLTTAGTTSSAADQSMTTENTPSSSSTTRTEPTTKSTTENLDSSSTKVTTPQSTAENLDSSSTKVTTPQSTTENLDSSSTKVTTPQSTTENLDSSSTKVTTSQSTTENLDSSSSYVTTSRSTTENIIQTTQIALSTTNTTDNSTLTSETPPGTTTMVTETTTGAPISTANISFPSVTVLAREDLVLECTIDVVENWDTVIASRELGTSSSVLALLSSNGTESHPTKSDLTSVTFTRHTDRITVVFHVKLATAVICPSLLRFKCGITMADIAETVIMKISDAEITAPINNVTLDMKTTYYSGERVELTCRTTTDYEYGQISLEVRLPDGSVLQDPAKRSMYESPRNSDCSVDFEWNYKTSFPMELALNGSVIRCIASNTLLNKTAVASEVVTVLQSDVSFTQYHVAAKPGERVSIHCQTSVATSAINSISIYKISNNTNATIANYANGVLTDSPGRSVTFEDGELKVEYINLQCSDEGQYFCTVTTGSSVIASPLPLTLQPTVEAGSTPVSLSLHVDVVEDTFHYTSEHSCSGEVGYPDVSGFLSLTISNPTTGETAIFNEKVISDAMKVYDSSVSSSLYLYSVLLADGLMLLVKENTTRQESCSSTHSLKFYLNASREWNEGKIRCEIQTEDASVQSSVVEETLYVIPVDVCEQFNETKVFFIDHEKFDNCNTYIQCEKNQPHGRKCAVRQCVYIGKAYCDDCSRAICTESPTTPISTTSTSTLSTTVTKAAKYVECTSSSVYQNELASISCHLNVSTFHSLNVSKNQVIIAFIRSDGTVAVLPEYSDKLHVSFSLSAQRVDVSIPSMSCSDDAKYSVVMEIENEDTIATTFAIVMKVKPNPPLITLHADLIDGQNQRTHSCTGDVGHPVGELEIQIKRPGETEFKNYHPANQKRVYSLSSKNCSNVQTMNFSIDLTADSWSNVTVRCVAFNPESLNSTDIVPSSTEYTISSVPSDYCSNKNSTYYEQHPMGCPYYVWCVTGRPYGYVCATKNLCINTESGHCV